ncbi:SPOR domain-containing protein [Marinobacter sp. F3R11]|uniref:SPOR domain-containing protein n=1 Tax=Marinobacter sp. F3R11 TaxID=2267231 RepID=UPI0016518D4B|nr:SPOR domain-containing protein [Marinobacter sp. F3R11]
MKWLALALLVLNVSFWYVLSSPSGYLLPRNVASGTLPRVGSLKSLDLHKGGPASAESVGYPAGADELSERSCATVGWFDSFTAAQSLAEEVVAAQSYDYQVREIERQLAPLHWVIIPPQPASVALEQLKRLQKRGIDSYLIARGENRNAISLGLFESREAAVSVLEEKKRQNLNAVLVNFPRNQLSYALSFEARSELVEKLVHAAEADYGNNFDFIEINACEGVATSDKTP